MHMKWMENRMPRTDPEPKPKWIQAGLCGCVSFLLEVFFPSQRSYPGHESGAVRCFFPPPEVFLQTQAP